MNSSEKYNYVDQQHFIYIKNTYNQNPQKAQFAAVTSAGITMGTSLIARWSGGCIPTTAKIAIFGLTAISNLVSLNMKEVSVAELKRVTTDGTKILQHLIEGSVNYVSEAGNYLFEMVWNKVTDDSDNSAADIIDSKLSLPESEVIEATNNADSTIEISGATDAEIDTIT
ncbi:MAG: hypothetical protein H6909_01550 [Rickettsiaceae bacterium]|nr:hypothetical protein [Rickettsiaceae bacterium]